MRTDLSGVDLAFIAVFFFCGLALFALGEAVFLVTRRSKVTRFAASLRFLAAFGLFGAVATWLDAGLVLTGSMPSDGSDSLRFAQVIFTAAAGTSLLLFGTRLVARSRRRRWLLPVPVILLGAWFVSLVIPHIGPIEATSSPAIYLCLECHRAQSSSFVVASGGWLTAADVWAHYLLYFPGALLAAGAFFSQRRRFLARGLPLIARHTVGASAAFAVTAISAGLVVPPAPYFPASLVNYASFDAALGAPAQLVTTIAAIFIAYSVVRILSVFEIQRSRQLARAKEERFAAQRATLEAQRRTQAEMADWNRQLESRVTERTRELEALHAQLKDVAILEERDRIARELHDSLAQVLGYLGLRASVLGEQLESGRLELAANEARLIEKVADDAYADVREAILGLRTKTAHRGLVLTLGEYLKKYALQTGIAVDLIAPTDDLRLSPSVEIQLLRVVQEALANVRKHAKAERVRLRFWRENGLTCIAVEDDGRGFDPTAEPPVGHYGLITMRERVDGVAGRLAVSSAPGKGTSVVVCLPDLDDPSPTERDALALVGAAESGES